MKDYPGQNFSKIEPYLRDRGPKKNTKASIHECCITTKILKIYNLTNSNASLMKLPTIMDLHEMFDLVETWDINNRV